jgi:hypothetical protein
VQTPTGRGQIAGLRCCIQCRQLQPEPDSATRLDSRLLQRKSA